MEVPEMKPCIEITSKQDKGIKNYKVGDSISFSGSGKIVRSNARDNGGVECSIEIDKVSCSPGKAMKEEKPKEERNNKSWFEKKKAERDNAGNNQKS